MKREIIFKMPDTTEYRVVCRYGYDSLLDVVWWLHVQKKCYYKKFIFFGEQKYKWKELDTCWLSKQIKTMDDLKDSAMNFYDKKVLLTPRLHKQAMEL